MVALTIIAAVIGSLVEDYMTGDNVARFGDGGHGGNADDCIDVDDSEDDEGGYDDVNGNVFLD